MILPHMGVSGAAPRSWLFYPSAATSLQLPAQLGSSLLHLAAAAAQRQKRPMTQRWGGVNVTLGLALAAGLWRSSVGVKGAATAAAAAAAVGGANVTMGLPLAVVVVVVVSLWR